MWQRVCCSVSCVTFVLTSLHYSLTYRKVAYGRYKEWCWNDLFVVRRCNKCVKRTMLKALQGGRQLFPSCDCL